MNAREGEEWETKEEQDNQLGGHWDFYSMPGPGFTEFTCVNPVRLQEGKVAWSHSCPSAWCNASVQLQACSLSTFRGKLNAAAAAVIGIFFLYVQKEGHLHCWNLPTAHLNWFLENWERVHREWGLRAQEGVNSLNSLWKKTENFPLISLLCPPFFYYLSPPFLLCPPSPLATGLDLLCFLFSGSHYEKNKKNK